MGLSFYAMRCETLSVTKDNIAYSAFHRIRGYVLEAVFGPEMSNGFEEACSKEVCGENGALDKWVDDRLWNAVQDKDTPEAWGVYALVNCSDCSAKFTNDDNDIENILNALNHTLLSGVVKDGWDEQRMQQIRDVFQDAFNANHSGYGTFVEMY